MKSGPCGVGVCDVDGTGGSVSVGGGGRYSPSSLASVQFSPFPFGTAVIYPPDRAACRWILLFYICGHQITHAIPVFRLHTAFYIFVNTCSYHIGHTPCPIGRIGAACIVLFPDNIFSIGFRVLLLQAANGICPLGQLGKRGKFIIFPKSMPRRPLDRNIIITLFRLPYL